MAIVFEKQKKKQKSLIYIVLFLIIVIALLVYFVFLKPNQRVTLPGASVTQKQSITINFDILEKIKEFQPYTEIQPLESEIIETEEGEFIEEVKAGRNNPFLP